MQVLVNDSTSSVQAQARRHYNNPMQGLHLQQYRAGAEVVLPEPRGGKLSVSELRKVMSLGTACKRSKRSSASSTNLDGISALDVRRWIASTATARDLGTAA